MASEKKQAGVTTFAFCQKCRSKTYTEEYARGQVLFRCQCGNKWSNPCVLSEFLANIKVKEDRDGEQDQRR